MTLLHYFSCGVFKQQRLKPCAKSIYCCDSVIFLSATSSAGDQDLRRAATLPRHRQTLLSSQELWLSTSELSRQRTVRFIEAMSARDRPNVIIPPDGGYWTDQGNGAPVDNDQGEEDCSALYRQFFWGKEHFNYFTTSSAVGPLILSLRRDHSDGEEWLHVLLRAATWSKSVTVPVCGVTLDLDDPNIVCNLVQMDLGTDFFEPLLFSRASEMLLGFDEHNESQNFKFGIIYQKANQLLEEEIFSNAEGSPQFEEFLSILGERVKLRGFTGYRGGLDVDGDQTGTESLFTTFKKNSVMFHVSTMLPFALKDSQQLQRKRHIGNDIVAIVFQEAGSTFAPDMIASQFLHAYIIVQPVDKHKYKITVAARDDVPPFGPALPADGCLDKSSQLREFLLRKLTNAERSCYKAEKIAALHKRTRRSLFEALCQDIRNLNVTVSKKKLSSSSKTAAETPKSRKPSIVKSVKRVFKKKKNSETHEKSSSSPQSSFVSSSGGSPSSTLGDPTKLQPPLSLRNDSSTSQRYSDSSDTGFSFSSAENSTTSTMSKDSHGRTSYHSTPHGSTGDSGNYTRPGFRPAYTQGDPGLSRSYTVADSEPVDTSEYDAILQEVTRLKLEKLDLIRQNVTQQHEIRSLRESQLLITSELSQANQSNCSPTSRESARPIAFEDGRWKRLSDMSLSQEATV